jgi:hypothetical protein
MATAGEPVRLTLSEARVAALVGIERQIDSLRWQRRNRPGVRPSSAWTIHVEGAGAELAFAKLMGWYWDASVGTFHGQADVGQVQVRRQREHHWDMGLRPHDVPGVYVLVTGCLPYYRVHGWAKWPGSPSYEAAYDPGRPAARYVRQADLRPLAELEGLA